MSSSTWCRQLPRKLCHVIIYCSTKELRPTRQAVGWESESEKIHWTCINYCWGRMGPTFRHCDFVEWGTRVTHSFVWVKIQGKVGDFCWHFLHSAVILSCWFRAEVFWVLARWYHCSQSEMHKIKDLRELQVLWLFYQTVLMCRLLESSDPENDTSF